MSSNQSVECPHCGSHYCPVRHTEHKLVTWSGKSWSVTRRHRVCQHCQVPFVTVETLEDEDHMGFPLIKNPDPPPGPKKPTIKKNPYIR